MRAAVIERYGEPPAVRDVDEPMAETGRLIEVRVAPVNPVDLSMASGRFYATPPATPYVPGDEGVGHAIHGGQRGPRVYFRAALPNGAMAERAVSSGQMVPLPDGLEDGVAAALGTPGIAAYLAVTKRANVQKGETVLILAASSVLGTIAVQVARLMGAGRIVAAARDDRALARTRELGADATVDLKQADGLTERIREASGGQLQVVIDPLWGAPAAAAIDAMSAHGRFVQLGQAAGPEATLKSNTVRGRYLSILGYSNYQTPWEEREAAYRALVDYAMAGKLKVEYEVLPLDSVPDAWKRQAQSPHRKLVLSPKR